MFRPGEYIVARVREAVARDERTHALDIRFRLEDGVLVLVGHVNCRERSELIERVVRENLPEDVEVVNDLTVGGYEETEEEALD